jgi:hypothetical protein
MGTVATGFDSSQSDVNINRMVAAGIQSGITTGQPSIKRTNNLFAVVAPGFDASVADLLSNRLLQSLISGSVLTNLPKTNVMRPLSSAIAIGTETSQVELWTSGIKMFLAGIASRILTSISTILDNRARFASSIAARIETDLSDISVARDMPILIDPEMSTASAKVMIERIFGVLIESEFSTDDIVCDIGWLGKIDHPSVASLRRFYRTLALARSYGSIPLYRENIITVLENHKVVGTTGNFTSVAILDRIRSLKIVERTLSSQIK